MRNALEFAFNSKELIAIYFNKNDTELFIVGKIVSIGQSEILLITFDSDATLDGLCLFKIDDVYRIEQKSQYLERIQDKGKEFLVLADWNESPWECFLTRTFNMQNKHVVYYLDTNKIKHGVLLDYSEHSITLRYIKKDGSYGGIMRVNRSRIAMIANDYPEIPGVMR